ncbi:uncharacterized protein LOC5500726 isoform X1 [Nematostella vectensis]|uniref:uncharacterized protein LOC5500726 isoform X1 n=1 Tax=Nematostella vectensis TaxID=45351 RepID=UPI00138FBBCB|nr:uncharacterized protein LOC5500726 isoform X1 [Nematostella vectensis]
MDQTKPTKEGYLKKYRNVFTGWAKRFFKLERSYLHYFESPHAPQPVGSITRGDIADVKVSSQYPGKENVFELYTRSGQVWYLQANSYDDMVDWMQALLPQKYFPRFQNQASPSQSPHASPSLANQEQAAHSHLNQQWPSPQGPEHHPVWQGAQGTYLPPQQGTPPMQGPYGPQVFDPRIFAPGGPLYDPRVHGGLPYSPPPPYSEAGQAEPLPSKTNE